MRKTFTFLFLFVTLATLKVNAQQVYGADVSWCTEMEADGKVFYDADGNRKELMQLLNGIGMNAIRLRVWVNPSYSSTPSTTCYGSAYCDKADVVAKAKRAKAAGMDVMIDFHYSDFFCDPSRQNIPNDWKSYSLTQLKAAVSEHTKDVLNALKAEGVSVKWIQIGNETAGGMLWDKGKITTGWTTSSGFTNYVSLYKSGYDAAKEVYADAMVMPHLQTGNNEWYYQWMDSFKAKGGKFDMIGFSHYPQTDDTSKTAAELNTKVANNIKSLYTKYGKKIMIVEIGVKVNDDETKATAALQDFHSKVKDLEGYEGCFYWEPQLYGWWKPAAYTSLGWNAYNMGAFCSNGKPSQALMTLVPAGIKDIKTDNIQQDAWYTLSGNRISKPSRGGVYINNKKKVIVK